jgi:hypothetical protein
MILTDDGILRTKETVEQLAAMVKQEPTTLIVWFCPFGSRNYSFIAGKEAFDRVYNDFVAHGRKILEQDSDDEFQFHVCHTPRHGVLWPPLENWIGERMGHLFHGPIEGTPSPTPDPAQVIAHWGDGVMTYFTMHGDEADTDRLPKT